MKKTICGLGSFILVICATFSVISCAPKTNKEVILEVQTDNQASSIVQAYRNVVDHYNQDRPDNPLKVKLLVTPLNSIKDKIATGLPLPNLYLAYADTMSNYDILLQLRDNQRSNVNMAEVVNWDENDNEWWNNENDNWIESYLHNGSQINHSLLGDKTLDQITQGNDSYRPLINSFLNESLIPGETEDSVFMYSAPVVKSNYIGVVNLRLLNELVVSVLGEEAKLRIEGKNETDIRGPFFIKNLKIDLKNVPLNSDINQFPLSSRNHYKDNPSYTFGDFFKQHFSGIKTPIEIQKSLGDLSNIEILLSTYWNLVGLDEGNTEDKWIKTLAYAIDDLNATTGLMQGQLSGNFKQINSWDPNQPYNLSINTNDQELHQGLEDFIDFIRWGNEYKKLESDGGSSSDHGNGGLGLKANSVSKDYYSNQWIKQGMLLYYGSSAGVKYWTGDKDNQVHDSEVILAPIPVYEDTSKNDNWSMLFRQQGAGVGMFKDDNILKNQIAIDFLNYFLSPEINVEFAIQAGYLPTNYEAYYETNNSEIMDGIYYKELLKGDQSRIKGANIIQSLIDQLVSETIKLWITEPSPFGDALNLQIMQPWFQKYYKTFFNGSPQAKNLTWEKYEQDFHKEAKRIINSMLPGISHIVWNGVLEE